MIAHSGPIAARSFHEKAGECQDGFVFLTRCFLLLSQAASVAILPSALFVSDVRSVPVGCSRFSGAATCESTSRPTFSVRVGPQDLVAVTWTRRLSSVLRTQFYATVLTPSQC